MLDTETGVYTELPDIAVTSPFYPALVVVPRGVSHRIYTFGGEVYRVAVLDSCSFIDVGEDRSQWTPLAAKMTTPRAEARAALLDFTTVAICGGFDDDGNVLSSCESLDLNTHTFSLLPDMLKPRYGHAVVHYNGTVVVLGGSSDEGTCEQLDPVAFKWTPFAPLPGGSHEYEVSGGYVKAAVVRDKIYAFIVYDVSVQVYDGTAWTAIPQIPKAPSYRSVVAVGGRLVAIGTATDAFDPVTNSWSRIPMMPRTGYEYPAVSF